MTCLRCAGLVVPLECDDGHETFLAERCLNCGEWRDRIITQHRSLVGPAPVLGRGVHRNNRTGQESPTDAARR